MRAQYEQQGMADRFELRIAPYPGHDKPTSVPMRMELHKQKTAGLGEKGFLTR